MKLFYILETPLGKEFFYDPISHEGVSIENRHISISPEILIMRDDYDPRIHPGHREEIEVAEEVFIELLEATRRYKSAIHDLQDALSHFPRVKKTKSE